MHCCPIGRGDEVRFRDQLRTHVPFGSIQCPKCSRDSQHRSRVTSDDENYQILHPAAEAPGDGATGGTPRQTERTLGGCCERDGVRPYYRKVVMRAFRIRGLIEKDTSDSFNDDRKSIVRFFCMS